jgi:glycerol kinase|tara:strand:- start:6173 stop:7663 length:1491 start_codon:yes stop_codon:yes gene_type:complete
MNKKYILALDAGTTSSRSILFDKKGNQIAISQYEFEQFFPNKGWVEHDPEEIWKTQLKSIEEVIKLAKISPKDIDSIGITNQRETTVIWNKNTGKPVYNAIVWQDRRTASICDALIKENSAHLSVKELFQEKTGLILDAYFSGTKIKWILDNVPNARDSANNNELAFGTIDTWLIWKLTNGKHHVTDPSNASRTLLYNIHELKWDDELLKLLDVPLNILPNLCQSSEIIGEAEIFNQKIRIAGIAGDQQAALFGQLCFNPGDVKNTYGTGCFCIMNTGENPVKSKNKMLTTIGYQINGKTTYAIEGSVFVAGALIQWLRDKLGIIKTASEIEALASSEKDSGGVTFIPSLSGLAAPYWDPHATGNIMGITRDTTKGHIARAALEAISLRCKEVVVAMEKDSNTKFNTLKVDGGASNNNLLMQIQANILESNVIRPKITETTALGAAFLAGLATGYFKNIEAIKNIWEKDKLFKPQKDSSIEEINILWNKRINQIIN